RQPIQLTQPSSPRLSTHSLHDALPISAPAIAVALSKLIIAVVRLKINEPRASGSKKCQIVCIGVAPIDSAASTIPSSTSKIEFSTRRRSEEHTSELQSRFDLVCRLLLEKKNRDERH